MHKIDVDTHEHIRVYTHVHTYVRARHGTCMSTILIVSTESQFSIGRRVAERKKIMELTFTKVNLISGRALFLSNAPPSGFAESKILESLGGGGGAASTPVFAFRLFQDF